MRKIKLQGFPAGSQVSLSATQSGATKGPLAVSAWKQPAASGNADFKIYSLWGTGDPGPRGGFELLEGALIEMPTPGNLSIYIDNETGFSTTDQRRLFYETDYGERYDAQFLNHPDLPAAFATFDTSPTTNTLGVYPGFTSGHVHRGTDMAGNPVLHKDYVNPVPGALVGTLDKTVSVFVSDGLVSKTKTFTVRLVDPHRYYTDQGGTNYGTLANTPAHLRGDRGKRFGVVYISRDGDFTGCPYPETGGTIPRVYHLTAPSGELGVEMFNAGYPFPAGYTLKENGVAKTGFPYPGFDYARAIYLKAGETYTFDNGPFASDPYGPSAPLGSTNSQLGSWGTANNGRAIISGENKRTYRNKPGDIFKSNEGGYTAWRFVNLEFDCSDFVTSNIEWREWWNELNYTGKTGTISGNTNGNLDNGDASNGPVGWQADILTNGNGVFTQVIGDVPDQVTPGAGKLRVRQIVTGGGFGSQTPGTFTDGDTLTGPTGSVVFVAAGSRQNRVPKNMPNALTFAPNKTDGANVIDGCHIRSPFVGINYPAGWSITNDTHIQNYFNYGFTGEGYNITTNALVISQPSKFEGKARDVGRAGVSPNRNLVNVVKSSDPEVPAENDISHCAYRLGVIQSWSMHKMRIHCYGGHGALHQPLLRLASNGSTFVGQQQVHVSKSIFSGGNSTFGVGSLRFSAPRTPRAWMIEDCWLRGEFCTENMGTIEVTNIGFKNCRIGFPADVTITQIRKPWNHLFMFFNDGDQSEAGPGGTPMDNSAYDINPLPPFMENCLFEYKAAGDETGSAGFITELRGIPVLYANNTLDVDATKVSRFDPLPSR
jgi:hypothetical protein